MGLQDERNAIFGAQVKRSVCSEISQGVSNQLALVNFHAAYHVRSAAQHQPGPGVDCGMSKLAKVASVFAEKQFVALKNVLVCRAFSSAVKGDNHQVGI